MFNPGWTSSHQRLAHSVQMKTKLLSPLGKRGVLLTHASTINYVGMSITPGGQMQYSVSSTGEIPVNVIDSGEGPNLNAT